MTFLVLSKDGLAVVTIGRPLIEWQNPYEVLPVRHFFKRRVRQNFKSMGEVAQCKLPTTGTSNEPLSAVNFNSQQLTIDEPVWDLDYLNLGHRQAKPQTKTGGEKFTGESAGAERVVLELDGVQVAIGRLHEVGLG